MLYEYFPYYAMVMRTLTHAFINCYLQEVQYLVEKLTVAQTLKNFPTSYAARRLNTTKIMPIRFVYPRIVANVSEQYSASILSGKLSLTLKINPQSLSNVVNHLPDYTV
jgi:hypothetical protein